MTDTSKRTLVIVELDGDVLSSQVDSALAAAGIHPAGETTAYDMARMRVGVEHSYRPDEVCRHCGYPDPLDGCTDEGFCTDCATILEDGAMGPGDDGPCKTCGTDHKGEFPGGTFTQGQLLEAVAFCPDCHWPEFEGGGPLMGRDGSPGYDHAAGYHD